MVSYTSQIETEVPGRLLFLVNSSRESIDTKLTFTEEVSIAGVGAPNHALIKGKTFELNVPPLGVLPLELIEYRTWN